MNNEGKRLHPLCLRFRLDNVTSLIGQVGGAYRIRHSVCRYSAAGNWKPLTTR